MRVSSLGRVLVLAAAGALSMMSQDGVVRLPSGPPAPQAPGGQGGADEPGGVRPSAGSIQPLAPQGLGDGVAPPVNPTFRVGPEDVLDIQVWREPQLSGQVVVRPDGKIAMILVGELEVNGKTIEEIQSLVKTRLSEVMNDPVVSVQLRAIRSSKYYIVGYVPRPGMYPLAVDTSVLEAIIMAGGITDLANPKKIRVAHKNGSQDFFNYNDVSKGKNLDQNKMLQSGDTIFVN